MVFQDPYSSLNPAKTIGWLLQEPLRAAGKLDPARKMTDADMKAAAYDMLQKKREVAMTYREKFVAEKLPQIRKFMNYYLPTTLKLLNAYDRMAATGVSGENIDGTKTRVEQMLGTIVTAFEKQLDSLFGAEALDISTDITVLETMMAREGLTGEQMAAETTDNVEIPDIKLEL